MRTGWNHNTHYHRLILRAVPQPCPRALDIGCGAGELATRLAPLCGEVIAMDVNPTHFPQTNAQNVNFIAGDALTFPLPSASFDLVTAVAVLHHIPLHAGLERMKALLHPGGVLVILGLFRPHSLGDWIHFAIARLASQIFRLVRRHDPGSAATQHPTQSLAEVRTAAAVILPGMKIQRRLLFRYTLTWIKPSQ